MLRDPAAITGVLPSPSVPQGASFDGTGTRFGLYSEHATQVELCLFDDASERETRVSLTRSDNLWHGYLPGVGPGQRYGYRVHGPYAPQHGHRFNAKKLLVDPYARAIDRDARWHPALQGEHAHDESLAEPTDSVSAAPRCVVIDETFDWQGDVAPRVPWSETLIYEAHVKGLTKLHPDVPEALRGTYLGLCAEPVIAHLKSLGVTALELLPVHHAFSERSLVTRGLVNYWGYNTLGFFAPDARFAAGGTLGEQVREWKTMVQALHRAGIEVILDVVYNHSAEADTLGPTLSLRGIDNAVYYRLDPDDFSKYYDTTGCGNSLNFGHPQTQRLVLDSLRYWVTEMHVDGFRFDLAPTLARVFGGLHIRETFFAALAQDPVLSNVKLIVEPWDCGPYGMCTGAFSAPYSEWNDRYRDGVRRFFRGDEARLGDIVTRVAGSSDVFQGSGRGPRASLNFITSHDGRSLRDLVSYEGKYNAANGWNNGDGADNEYPRNWGAEGATDRTDVNAVRERVARSMLLTLACSQGVPMLRQGDELFQTANGNNNAYTQDNAVSWVPWHLSGTEREHLAFVRKAFELRREHSSLRRAEYFTGALRDGDRDVTWLAAEGGVLTGEHFSDPQRRALGAWIAGDHAASAPSLLVLFNAGSEPVSFALPLSAAHTSVAGAAEFRVLLDSAQPRAADTPVRGAYRLEAHATALLIEQPPAPVARKPDHVQSLRALADRYGIANGYRGYHGDQKTTTDATRVVLLAAMGVDASTPSAAKTALEAVIAEESQPGVAPVRVLPLGADALRSVELRFPGRLGHHFDYSVELTLESGDSLRSEGRVQAASGRASIGLPELVLPIGYHRLKVEMEGAAGSSTEQDLIVTPASAETLEARLGNRLGAGLWSHLYALRRTEGGFGIGDTGDLRALMALASAQGLDFVGINPLHALDNYGGVVSPYYPLSRSFVNPIYLDLEAVPELAHSPAAQSILRSPALQLILAPLRSQSKLDYANIWRQKRRVLSVLCDSFAKRDLGKDTPRGRAYAQYVAEQGDALGEFALFGALGEHVGGEDTPLLDFNQFPEPLRDSRSRQVTELREKLAPRVLFHSYLQFELDRQLGSVQREARASGMPIGVYGDLAVGNAPGGADVWARRDLFARGVNLGAPPDIYSDTGQDWGLLPLVPARLRQDRYRYLRGLFRNALRNVGMLRADHVMGLLRQFWVPQGLDARSGAYVRFPFEEITGILSLESVRAGALVVGEDLGVVPDGLRERMRELALLRSQVLYFERDNAGEFVSPSEYARESLATVNSHDLPPLAAFFDGHDLELLLELGQLPDRTSLERVRSEREAAKAALQRRLIRENLWTSTASTEAEWMVAIHRLLVSSRAALVAASVDDLCMEREPLNVPGIASEKYPPWARRTRMPIDALARDPNALAIFSVLRARTRA
ncbi:MAG TPA: glycogen debranching protein GlgX [Polyangiales bacterium]|nr:glycogen debranching protein GlgX [Polyangiales bacterium]